MGPSAAAVILLPVMFLAAFVFFVVLVVRAVNPVKFPTARMKVLGALVFAATLSIFGLYWWGTWMPEHLSTFNVLVFCLLPGLGVGAIISEIVARVIALARRYIGRQKQNVAGET